MNLRVEQPQPGMWVVEVSAYRTGRDGLPERWGLTESISAQEVEADRLLAGQPLRRALCLRALAAWSIMPGHAAAAGTAFLSELLLGEVSG